MLKNGISYTEIRKASFSRLSLLLNLQIEYAKEEERLIKKSEESYL